MHIKTPGETILPAEIKSLKPVRDLISGNEYWSVNGERCCRKPIGEMPEQYRSALAYLAEADCARMGLVNDDDTPITKQQFEEHFEHLTPEWKAAEEARIAEEEAAAAAAAEEE